MANTTCLFSTIRNVSGKKMRFGMLPPHGRELEVDEEFTVFGNIQEAVVRSQRVTSRRHQQALEDALRDGNLFLVETPSPILFDESDHESKQLNLDGGSLGVVDPCYGSFSSSAGP